MVGDLLLREGRGLLLRAPTLQILAPLLTKSWLRACGLHVHLVSKLDILFLETETGFRIEPPDLLYLIELKPVCTNRIFLLK